MDELMYKTVIERSDTFNQLEEWAASRLQTNLSSFIDRGMAMASIDNVFRRRQPHSWLHGIVRRFENQIGKHLSPKSLEPQPQTKESILRSVNKS